VRGPNVTPGYWRRRIDGGRRRRGLLPPGDAVRFVDANDPAGARLRRPAGGRLQAHTGTWVHVGALRVRLLAAASRPADAVIAGADVPRSRPMLAHAPAAQLIGDGAPEGVP